MFDQDTPVELVVALRPDVYVKGGDYTIDDLPEAPVVREYGGEVKIIPVVKVDGRVIGNGRPGKMTITMMKLFKTVTKKDGVKY